MPSSICFFFALSRNIDQWFLGMLERDVGEKDRGAGSKQIGYPQTPAALELVRGLHPITQYQWILTGTRAAGVPSQFSPVEQIALSGVEFLDPRLTFSRCSLLWSLEVGSSWPNEKKRCVRPSLAALPTSFARCNNARVAVEHGCNRIVWSCFSGGRISGLFDHPAKREWRLLIPSRFFYSLMVILVKFDGD